MKQPFIKIVFTIVLLLTSFVAFADDEDVKFEVTSPLMVAVGEAFRVEFSLNAKADDDAFKAPSFEGFDVLAGPAVSKGSSMQIINGDVTRSVNYTYTFVLLPKSAGNGVIGIAEIEVDGETYKTRSLPIEIIDEPQSSSSTQQGAQGTQGGQGAQGAQGGVSPQQRIAKDDILVRAVVSKTNVYKNEPITLTFKFYSRVPIVGSQGESWPSFNGFWAQELERPKDMFGRETYNGKVYDTQILRQYLLYPQQSGRLTIDAAELTLLGRVVVQNRNVDPFFGGGHEVFNVPREVSSGRITITVKDLPAGAPESFAGAVGEFTMEMTPPDVALAANSGSEVVVRVAGSGNLTFIQSPKLNLPESFELYNVKTTESINANTSGISGYRQFEYPFIARAEGDYKIDPIEFSYFNPKVGKYVTLKSDEIELKITPDKDSAGSDSSFMVSDRALSREQIKMLGQDIHFITLGKAHLHKMSAPLLFSSAYWQIIVLIFALFGVVYLLLRRRIRESKNLVLVRGKRANKVAVQRLRAAKEYMLAQNRKGFYEEMLQALWGYIGDKLNIPVAALTKDSVRQALKQRSVDSELIERYINIVTQCDEAQYSPLVSHDMGDVYSEGVDIVSCLEGSIKK